jgi:DNA-directed RNA polymerase alpha subunit
MTDKQLPDGMTLRDYFAAKALQGMLVNMFLPDDVDNVPEFMAKTAYRAADAMLRVRGEVRSEVPVGRKIEELYLVVRAVNILKGENICTIEQLVNQTPNHLLKIPNMGRKTVAEIVKALAAHGLKLRDPRNAKT